MQSSSCEEARVRAAEIVDDEGRHGVAERGGSIVDGARIRRALVDCPVCPSRPCSRWRRGKRAGCHGRW